MKQATRLIVSFAALAVAVTWSAALPTPADARQRTAAAGQSLNVVQQLAAEAASAVEAAQAAKSLKLAAIAEIKKKADALVRDHGAAPLDKQTALEQRAQQLLVDLRKLMVGLPQPEAPMSPAPRPGAPGYNNLEDLEAGDAEALLASGRRLPGGAEGEQTAGVAAPAAPQAAAAPDLRVARIEVARQACREPLCLQVVVHVRNHGEATAQPSLVRLSYRIDPAGPWTALADLTLAPQPRGGEARLARVFPFGQGGTFEFRADMIAADAPSLTGPGRTQQTASQTFTAEAGR